LSLARLIQRAAAIDAPVVELVGSFGGALTTLAISGTLAYVGEGAGLTIVDVGNSEPASLALSRTQPVVGFQLFKSIT
jgi:hypothetical protein